MDDLICTLALKKIKGLKNIHIFLLLKTFKNPCDIFDAGKPDFLKAGLKGEQIEILRNTRVVRTAFFEAINEIEEASKNGIKIITYNSPLYPYNLNFIRNKPIILYYKGVLKENLKFAAAVVGQRNPPDYSLKLAQNLTEQLCSSGFSIISGLAMGIDAVAHNTALKNNCYTIAYIGSGLLESVYPPENRNLYQEIILRNGAIVSEFPLHSKISAKNLIARDRLQSGSSLGTFAISSPVNGGTMKTCGFSLKQKRPVFVPEYAKELMDSKDNSGLKSLLGRNGVVGLKLDKDGALDLAEVMDELRIVYNDIYEEKTGAHSSLLMQPGLFG
ncbi:MAG: DNA-processing protein DprA [Deltaproteobacteria bacterium]|jgi:DNA processing protein|nr:DNA-protecting protein DprA [Deltaproteobacteria bacterium]MCL5879387.1 DNA-protecting protein DprA [Deltaproteobacteria bacterium]MDA8304402.1 DNA-processing protein DprA [Deltaproteobacteria bacterium]